MLSEDVEDPYYNGVVLLLGLGAKDEDVVHVDDHNFIYEFMENFVHHCQECLWAVSETKEHD